MSVSYNSDILYNNFSVSYDGAVRITVSGISNPIHIGNLILTSLSFEDNTNSTTVGVITFDSVPSGYIAIYPSQNVTSASISAINSSDQTANGLLQIETRESQTQAISEIVFASYPNASITVERI